MEKREVWISYLDDTNKVVHGFVILLEQMPHYIKFKNDTNIITISYNRLIKLKEKSEDGR